MAIRNLRYEGDEILRKRSKEIEVIDDRIKELAQDMMDTMHKWDGLGLAAPQVGILKRIIVIDLYEEGTQFVLINPKSFLIELNVRDDVNNKKILKITLTPFFNKEFQIGKIQN